MFGGKHNVELTTLTTTPPNIILDLFPLLVIPYSCVLIKLMLYFQNLGKQSSTEGIFFTDQFDNHPWENPVNKKRE